MDAPAVARAGRAAVYAAWIVETGQDRAAAYALHWRASEEQWEAALYGDATGWVVRLTRRDALTGQAVLDFQEKVQRLADIAGGTIRGVWFDAANSFRIGQQPAAVGNSNAPIKAGEN